MKNIDLSSDNGYLVIMKIPRREQISNKLWRLYICLVQHREKCEHQAFQACGRHVSVSITTQGKIGRQQKTIKFLKDIELIFTEIIK